ncbi:biotin/lipoate--protein ligase family protein [Azospirillum formosense]|uniref:biotin/lipoate--protein ligase family protein n=1 Tax=Azospirillum formosense TaxID=861533 RepID=UPI00338ECA3B
MDPTDHPTLPPIFRPWPAEADGPFATACRFAAQEAAPGTLVHSGRRDRLDVAVVLVPDRPDAGTASPPLPWWRWPTRWRRWGRPTRASASTARAACC